MESPLLSVRDLRTYFDEDGRVVRAVDGVSFELRRGETLGIVGESGSGKSVTNLSVMRLIPSPPGRIASGDIVFDGVNLLAVPDDEMRRIRGRRMAMIFQDPMTSLNPFMRISRQLMEVTELHLGHSRAEARAHAIRMLEQVGIPDAATRMNGYPHELSGGMRQRVMIAMALSCKPELLIADEPTTALDVTIQAQILDLIRTLKKETGTSVVLITHDLGVVAGMTDRIVVMYAGKIMESAPTTELFARPGNPYTKGLLLSVPDPSVQDREDLYQIPGLPPDVANLPPGCPFAARCDRVEDICRREFPPFVELTPDHHSLCHFAHEVWAGGAGRAGEAGRAINVRSVRLQPDNVAREIRLKPDPTIPAVTIAAAATDALISISDLTVHFNLGGGTVLDRLTGGSATRKVVRAVDGVSLDIKRGETLGLVGESGCGKTTMGRAILRLTDVTSGRVMFKGKNLAGLSSSS